MSLPTQYYIKDNQPHLRAPMVLALLTDTPETAAALAKRSGIPGMTAQIAGRILGYAVGHSGGMVLSSRDRNQSACLCRMVYWRKL